MAEKKTGRVRGISNVVGGARMFSGRGDTLSFDFNGKSVSIQEFSALDFMELHDYFEEMGVDPTQEVEIAREGEAVVKTRSSIEETAYEMQSVEQRKLAMLTFAFAVSRAGVEGLDTPMDVLQASHRDRDRNLYADVHAFCYRGMTLDDMRDAGTVLYFEALNKFRGIQAVDATASKDAQKAARQTQDDAVSALEAYLAHLSVPDADDVDAAEEEATPGEQTPPTDAQ